MKTKLFLVLPSISHYHSIFGYANSLHHDRNNIIFVGTRNFEELIVENNFQFIEWQYGLEYTIKSFRAFLGLFIRNSIDNSLIDGLNEKFELTFTSLRKIIAETKPTTIFIDEVLAEYYLFFRNLGIETIILCTNLSTRKIKGIPPMDSFYQPKNSFYSNVICNILWINRRFKNWLKRRINSIAFMERGEKFLFQKYAESSKTDLNKLFDYKNYFFTGIIGTKRIILAEENLEYPWKISLTNEDFFHNEIIRNEKKHINEKYLYLLKKIKNFRKKSENKVIYISFGTVNSSKQKRIEKFYHLFYQSINPNDNFIIIVSKSNYNADFELQTNTYVLDFIPQLDLLKNVDLMITHGGLNTIRECIQNKVKMLVVPYFTNGDQPGNAKRVEYLGLGISVRLFGLTSKILRQKINAVLYN